MNCSEIEIKGKILNKRDKLDKCFIRDRKIEREKMEFFSRLNLDQSATRDDVERSYKHLSRVYHPGKFMEKIDFGENFGFLILTFL